MTGEKVKRRALTLFFGCQLLGCSGRFALSYNDAKDNFTFVKATKTFTIIGQNNERIDQTNSKTKKSSEEECQRREIYSGVASSMVHRVKEDQRREAIGFEIPVARGAFDHRKGSTDDKYTKQHWP